MQNCVCWPIQNRIKGTVEIAFVFDKLSWRGFFTFSNKSVANWKSPVWRFMWGLSGYFAYSVVKCLSGLLILRLDFHWTVDLLPMDGFWNCWIPCCVSRCSGGVHLRGWECCRLLRVDCLDQVSSLDPGCWSMDLQSSRRPSPCESSGVTTYPGQLLVGVLSHLRII